MLARIQRWLGAGNEAESPESQLAPGLSVKGDITGDGDLAIFGNFEGEIDLAGTVRIAPGAEVDGNIRASAIVIGGTVRGNVAAATRIDMLPTGALLGSVKGGSFFAVEGASMRGDIWLDPPASAELSESFRR